LAEEARPPAGLVSHKAHLFTHIWIGQKVGGVTISQDFQKMAPPIPPIKGLKTDALSFFIFFLPVYGCNTTRFKWVTGKLAVMGRDTTQSHNTANKNSSHTHNTLQTKSINW